MLQQVNLYQVEKPAGQGILTAVQMAQITGLLVLVLGGVAGHAGARAWLEGRQFRLLEQEKQAQQALVSDLRNRASGHKTDPSIVAQVRALEDEVGSKTQLLDTLANPILGNTLGFSGLLRGLARGDVHGVWLKTIGIHGSGTQLTLMGNAVMPEAVPEFLEQLSEQPAFAGRKFESFHLERVEQGGGLIEFLLATTGGLMP